MKKKPLIWHGWVIVKCFDHDDCKSTLIPQQGVGVAHNEWPPRLFENRKTALRVFDEEYRHSADPEGAVQPVVLLVGEDVESLLSKLTNLAARSEDVATGLLKLAALLEP